MKKITLLLLLLFFSFSGYSQLPLEGFENTTGPDGLPSTNWTLPASSAIGNWAVFDNGVGTAQRWGINTTAAQVYAGTNAAYMKNENIGQGNTSRDFLATPLVHIPSNGQLHFWTRSFSAGNQGTIYKVMVASGANAANQTNPVAYSTVQQWTEATLTTTFNVYQEKIVDLGTSFANSNVYVAFVMEYTQPTTALGGDRWLIDNVSIVEQCTDPTTLSVVSTTSTTATLTWGNPSGATSWEIEVVPSTGTPTGIGTVYNGTLPYVATGLTPNTSYTFYVKAICTASSSAWVGPSGSFTTQVAPPQCGGNYVDSGGAAGNYSNNENITTTICPSTPGEAVTVTFTAFNTEAGADLLKIYNGDNSVTATLIGTYSGAAIPPSITSSAANGCLTFVFTSNANTTSTGYAATITCGTPPACPKPIALAAGAVLSTSASLGWVATGSATSWQVLALPCTSPAPTAATTGWTSTTDNPYVIPGLTPDSCYNLYVRSDCGGSGVSEWAGPVQVTTQIAPPVCGGTYTDTGGAAGNYPNNANVTTTICPITSGDVVTVTFTSFNTEATDLLNVYNGDNSFGTLIGTYSGNTIPPAITSSASNGCLTFVFTSNATTNAAGWEANVTCAPPPPCQQPIALTTSAVLSTTASLGWTNAGTATTWQVLALPCSDPAPTAATTGWVSTTDNPASITGLNANACYNLYVRSDCGANGVSEWSGPASITTQIAPPVCGGNYVDSGGTTGNYTSGENITTTICPSTPGDVVTVTFTSFNTEPTWDGIYVFDGNSITATPILSTNPVGNANGPLTTPGAYWGTTIPEPFTSTSPDGCLTFQFLSDPSVTDPGFIANITCAPPTSCVRPTALVTSTILNNSVTVAWTQPPNADASQATEWQVIAVPCGGPTPDANTTGYTVAPTNPFTLGGLTATTCYDIYVRAVCSGSETSVWLGPKSVTTDVDPPVCGGVFTDSAGPNANYINNSNSTVTICPVTPGDVVTVTFTSFDTEANTDLLKVYNGNAITGTLIGTFSGTAIPPALTSSDPNGCLTFVFTSNGFTTGAGWTADVTCAPPPPCQQPIGLTTSALLSTSVSLGWTNAGSATSWQVLAVPCTDPTVPTDTTTGWVTATTNPFVVTDLLPNTCYRFYVRSDCNDASAGVSLWSLPISVTTQVAPPVCGGNFVDSEGPNTNYLNSTDSTVTICPNSPTDVVTVTFTSFFTETNWDGLLVYDGNSITAPQIASTNGTGFGPIAAFTGAYWGNLTGANLPGPFTSSSADGCLTFRFISDPSVNNPGWEANVSCSPAPLCPKPTALTATDLTPTSALLGWAEQNPNVTSWQVLVLPLGSPAPLPDATGWTTVSINPVLWTGLNPGTQYTFYVRSVCPDSVGGGTSLWSAGHNFTTLIINDDCAGAVFAPVNSSAECQQTTEGTIAGATASTVPLDAPCVGNADDDVWFQYIATNPYLNIALQSITPAGTNLDFAVYSGSCGTLTQIFCSGTGTSSGLSGTVNGMTVGETYFIRVYSNGSTPVAANFNICISTPSTCPTASTVCSLTDYVNTTGVTSLGTIGCLFTSPNPAYFTIQVATSGPINYTLTQSTQPSVGGVPGPANIDVDYAAWGPFTSQDEACTFIGSAQPFAPPGIGVPVTQQTGCSYSAAPTETLNIANAVAGQFYIILITNFSNQPGYITLVQNNVNTDPNHGETNCCPNASFSYNPVTYCKEAGAPNPVAQINSGSVAGTFTSSPPGLVFANTATGEVDLAASAAGLYIITNTLAATSTCLEKSSTSTIEIVEPVTASFTYDAASYCNSITTPQLATLAGATGGTYSVSPNGGLFIDVATGSITPSLSSPGIYTVTYILPGSGACVASNPTAQVEIIATPVIAQPAPVVVCGSYTLPALTVGNYYTGINGTGTQLAAGDVISTIGTTTLHIYADNNGCTNEKDLSITINSDVTADVLANVGTCASYTLPVLSAGNNYYTGPGGTGTQLNAGDVITTNQTINIYVSNGTCSDESSFTVTIGSLIVVTPGNGAYCDSYTLPALAAGNYFTGANGTGTQLNAGDVITTPQLIHVYVNDGVCTGDETFTVTINSVPTPTYTVTQPDCTTPTGTITITAPVSSNTLPDLFISEVTDEDVGSLSYIEIYNGTGSAKNLADYKLKVYNNGNASPSNFCDFALSGTLNNGDVYVIAVGSATNQGGIIPDLVVANCAGFNNNDNVQLTTSGDVVIDSWGTTDGSIFTPANQPGYTYQRNTTATIPSLTWNASDWTALDPQDYTNVGSYTYPAPVNNYQYSIDNGVTYQSGLTFANLAAGTYDIVVKDMVTGCTSITPVSVVINAVNSSPSVTTIAYASPVCKLATVNPTPDTSAAGFTSGGTYSEINTTGLVINPTTGEIDLALSTAGTHTVQYAVLFNSATCQAASASTYDIVIQAPTLATVGFSYTSPICQIASPSTLNPTLVTGFTSGGTFSSTAGLSLNATTGAIDLVASTAGTYYVTYTVAANSTAPNCQDLTVSSPVEIIITPATNVNVIFTYPVSVCKLVTPSTVSPTLDPGFTNGGTFTSTPSGLSINASTGVINVANSNAGTYSITYATTDNPTTCKLATTSAAFVIDIVAPTIPGTTFSYTTPICASNIVLSPIEGTGFTTGGSYSSTGLNVDSATGEVTVTAETAPGTYTITYSVAEDVVNCQASNSGQATIVISSPLVISINGDCDNSAYVLTVSPASGVFETNTLFAWTNGGSSVGTDSASITVDTPGTYTVVVSSPSSCPTTSAPITVTIDDLACMIQKGISVNGDDKNDYFDLSGFNVKKLTIFNRYGMKVYDQANYTNQWKGQADNGDELPDGTYYYVFDRSNGETKTGWIYINRAQ